MLAVGLGGLAGAMGAGTDAMAASEGEVVVTTPGKINHITLDEENLYWSESTASITRLRKQPLSGGAIIELASEPVKDSRGYTVTYWHLQQTEDSLIWSRKRVGFYQHFSLRIIPKAGGDSRQILKEGYSESPLPLIGWRVAGKTVAVALLYPHATSKTMTKSTRIGAYDLETKTWSSLITGHFQKNEAFILAVDGDDLYLRGTGTEDDTLELGRVSVTGGHDSYTTLRSSSGTDNDLAQLGAVDGTNVYYWSEGKNEDRIMASATAGGGSPQKLAGGDLGTGLTTDRTSLYWQVKETVYKLDTGGHGSPKVVYEGAYRPAAVGGLAVDGTHLYLAVQAATNRFQIVRLPK